MPDDQPEILDEVITPAQPIDRPGSPHARGIGEGIAIAVVLVLVLGGMGFVAFGRPSGTPAASPSASPGAAVATASAEPTILPSPTAIPTPGPAVTPATACAATSPTTPPAPMIHTPGFRWLGALASDAWLKDPAAAKPDPDTATSATTVLAEPLILSLDRRWCALAWRFTLDGFPIAAQDNPTLDPAYASQDAWSIRLPAMTDPTPLLRAELEFPLGWSVSTWRVTYVPSPVPEAFIASGDATANAARGCGFSLQLRNGATTSETCATTIPANDADHLLLEPDVQMAFRVPGAAFEPDQDAAVVCGRVGGSPPDFIADPECVLDLGFDPSNALTFTSPGDPGTWWIAIQGCTTSDGNRACGRWYGIVDIVAPEATPKPS